MLANSAPTPVLKQQDLPLVTTQTLFLPRVLDELLPEARWFVVQTLQEFVTDACYKYVKGQQTHGGELWHREALPEISNEVVDLVFYVASARKRQAEYQSLAAKVLGKSVDVSGLANPTI
jgi:cell division inhibitor SulA